MPGKGEEGFKLVVDYLNQNRYIGLANDLVAAPSIMHFLDDGVTPEQNQTAVDVHQTTSTISKPLTEAQDHLSYIINLNVDSIAEIWSGLIHLPTTWSTYVDVQILKDFKDDKGKTVHEYKEVFGNVSEFSFNRILIQGDPGCGKSTYANKIALDWANKNEYLREKFHLVFLIPLQTLSTNIEQAIQLLLPEGSIEFVEGYYKHHSSKVLLILDGFDELPKDSEFYTEVMRMLNAKLTQFQFFTIVITTRRSHVDNVPQRYHRRSLLIKGFNEQSMKQFLQIQKAPVPDEQTDSNLIVLLQNPLFCTIYCSLHFFKVDKSKLEDPYDFIKALVDYAVKNDKRTKEITNEEEQLKLLGAFAFQKLNSETLHIVDKIFIQKYDDFRRLIRGMRRRTAFFDDDFSIFLKEQLQHVETIDMDKIQLALLIKKKDSIGWL